MWERGDEGEWRCAMRERGDVPCGRGEMCHEGAGRCAMRESGDVP